MTGHTGQPIITLLELPELSGRLQAGDGLT